MSVLLRWYSQGLAELTSHRALTIGGISREATSFSDHFYHLFTLPLLKIKPTSPHACACFSPYLEFCFSFLNFPELMQFTVIITVIIIFDLESF